AADPFQSQDKQVTAKELLDKAANKIETNLNDQPEVKARLLEAIGEAYLNQGQSQSAIQYLNQALQMQRKHLSDEHEKLQLIPVLNNLGRAYSDTGDFESANQVLKEALDYYNDREFVSPGRLQTLINNGALEIKASHLTAAQHYYEQALDVAQQLYGNKHTDTAGVLMSLAQVLIWQGNYSHAEPIFRQVVDIYHQQLPNRDPDRMLADLSHAEALYYLKQFAEASTLANQVLFDQKTVFGNSNPQLINTYYILSELDLATGQTNAAEQAARKGLEIANNTLGDGNYMTAEMHSAVANVLIRKKQYGEAQTEAALSLKELQSELPPDHQYIASAEFLLAAALTGLHRNAEAASLLQTNIERWTRTGAPAWRAARSESLLGVILMRSGKVTEAGFALTHAFQMLSATNSGADDEAENAARKRLVQYKHCMNEHHLGNCQINE
ncbi:MAG: tetratricopeptide repeat protein, partial [Solimonas sp.]